MFYELRPHRRRFFLLIILTFSLSSLKAQDNSCIEITKEVYSKLIRSIGNNFPSPPRLDFSDEERYVAVVKKGKILIENKALQVLCNFSDQKGAIAYVLSHELAHYYLSHSWMTNTGLSFKSSIGQFLNDKALATDERKIEEAQADLFGGFFSLISGYDSLNNAPSVLDLLYKEYNLPHKLMGYPTLAERKQIIKANIEEAKKLFVIFEAGKLNLIKGDYQLAEDCYQHILNKRFTSREIYNNLGVVYLNIAINNFDKNISKFIYPIFSEINTRLEYSNTRETNSLLVDPEEYLNLSTDMFKRSISLDNNFYPAKLNLIISQMINDKVKEIDGKEKLLNRIKNFEDIVTKDYYDLLILSKLLFSETKKDASSLLDKGSTISKLNFETKYTPKIKRENKNNKKIEKYSQIDFDELRLFGIKKPYQYVSSGNGIKIKKKEFTYYDIYEINNTDYFIIIRDKSYFTIKKIKIGSHVTEIEKNYGKPDKVHKFGNQYNYIYRNQKIIFTILDSKVLNIIIYT